MNSRESILLQNRRIFCSWRYCRCIFFSNDNPYRIEFFGDEVESIRSFDVATQLSLEKQKKITIIPNVENKVFRKTEKVFRLYFGENGAVYQNSEDLFSQLDKQFDRAEEAFENCQRTSNMPRQINYF
jgi:transcription-repair coupling factor (superfamily II helicase)